jgi:hypothetical protein
MLLLCWCVHVCRGLGSNPDQLKWFAESERVHCRWAMLAVAGILGQVGRQQQLGAEQHAQRLPKAHAEQLL